MTLVEMVIAIVALGAALFLLVGWTRTVRDQARTQLAAELLVRLDRALAEYHAAEGVYPPALDGDSTRAVALLLRHPRASAWLDTLPESLQAPAPPRTLLDPWGGSLRFLSDPNRHDVRANAGRPIFVSAGRDRTFGDAGLSALADDLRSDDPHAEGFRDAPVSATSLPTPD